MRQAADSQPSSERALNALSELCHIYWRPVYLFLRREGLAQHDAQDLTGGPSKAIPYEEICRAQKSNVLPIEQLKAAHVPHRLRSLLKSVLAVEPAMRPSTHELAAQLQRCDDGASGARRARFVVAAAAVLLFGGSAFFVSRSLHIENLTWHPAVLEKSIAVLPFESLSPRRRNQRCRARCRVRRNRKNFVRCSR